MENNLLGKIGKYASSVLVAAAPYVGLGCNNKIDTTPGYAPIVTPVGNSKKLFGSGTSASVTSAEGQISFQFGVTDYDGNLSQFRITTDDATGANLEHKVLDNNGEEVDLGDVRTNGIYTLVFTGNQGTTATATFTANDTESNVSRTYSMNMVFGGDSPEDQDDDNDDPITPTRLDELLDLACSDSVQNLRSPAQNILAYQVGSGNGLTENVESTDDSDPFHHSTTRGGDYILLGPTGWTGTRFSEIPDDLDFSDFQVVDAWCGAAVMHDAYGTSTVTVSGNQGATSEVFVAENTE